MKYVILNSGGIDSLALAGMYRADELHSLHIHQGHPSSDAQAVAAQAIAAKYCASHTVIELHGLALDPAASGYLRPIAYQTQVLAIIGSAFAYNKGIVSVLSGNKHESVSKDFEKYFLQMMQTAKLDERLYSRPLGGLEFKDVYQIVKDDELLPQTVSCLALPKCGVCPKCIARSDYHID